MSRRRKASRGSSNGAMKDASEMICEDLTPETAECLTANLCPDCHRHILYLPDYGLWFCPFCSKGHAIVSLH